MHWFLIACLTTGYALSVAILAGIEPGANIFYVAGWGAATVGLGALAMVYTFRRARRGRKPK